MICPECEVEYREGFTRCADCDVALVHDLDAPAGLMGLTVETWPDLVATLLQWLEQEEIPYVIEAGTALPLLDGEEESLDQPRPWKARVWVATARFDQAREMLAMTRAGMSRQE